MGTVQRHYCTNKPTCNSNCIIRLELFLRAKRRENNVKTCNVLNKAAAGSWRTSLCNLYVKILIIPYLKKVPVTPRSKAWVCGRSPAEIVGSNSTGNMDVYLLCVLSGRGLCDELITRPEESYRLWCVVVCDLETSRMRMP